MPIYNAEDYLKECLDSLVRQTYRRIEIILVNDGSTDNSGKIANSYARKDHRVRVFHQKNRGVSAARNKGIRESEGKFIVFVDSDDICDLDMIRVLYENINEADASACKLVMMDEDIKVDKSVINKPVSVTKMDSRGFLIGLLYQEVNNGPVCKLFRKSTISNLFFDENLEVAEDLKFNYDFSRRARNVRVINGTYYFYRRNPNSIMRRDFSLARMSTFDVCDYIEGGVGNVDYELTRALQRRRLVAACRNLIRIYLSDGFEQYISIAEVNRDIIKKLFIAVMFDVRSSISDKMLALSVFFGRRFFVFLYGIMRVK